jgi:hypothetical protein
MTKSDTRFSRCFLLPVAQQRGVIKENPVNSPLHQAQ